jgi:cysteine desulfurase
MKATPPALTSQDSVYLDYNATAPLLPVAREAMLAAWEALPGNPSSPHRHGQAARDALETGRARLAALLGCSRREVLLTSGGTEGNNLLLRWLAQEVRAPDGPPHLITTPIEHPSVLRCAEWLAEQGVAVDYLPVNADGVVQVEAVEGLLRPRTRLVSMMAANNETGVIQPVAELVRRVRAAEQALAGQPAAECAPRVLIHSDAVQAFGRIPVDVRAWGVDALTLAAHKLGGPKGVGAVFLRDGIAVPPLLLGGRQERDRRAGTESVALLAGFVAAAQWALDDLAAYAARLADLRDGLIERLRDTQGFFLNGERAPLVPNTANLGFAGVPARSLLVALDLAGVAVSTGSACSSGAIEPSHVLQAMGLPPERLEASLRISLGHASSPADVERCAVVLRAEVQRLRERGRRAAS